MMHVDALTSISDDELFARVERLTARSNVALADLLAHLGEVERRGIHRLRASASLYTYCVYELRMSEDAAFRRAKAARLVREYPELGDAIAKGEIHLTGVLMIGPHLGGERHAEILRRSRFRSKRELLRLIAEIDPKPEVPALVEPLGPAPAGRATHAAFVEALAGPERRLPPGKSPEDWMPEDRSEQDWMEKAEESDDDARPCTETRADVPDAEEARRPLHYRVQFTATQEFVDLLEEVRSLLDHERSGTELPDVQLRALRALVKELRGKKRAATDRPREQGASRTTKNAPERDERSATAAPERETHAAIDLTDVPARASHAAADFADAPARASHAGADFTDAPARASHAAADFTDAPARAPERASRHVPAGVRRAVFERDACRCAYRDERGERCRETRGLEIHHRHAHALGGPPTLENLELRCRSHNTLAAERDFGRGHMDWMRGVAEGSALERAR